MIDANKVTVNRTYADKREADKKLSRRDRQRRERGSAQIEICCACNRPGAFWAIVKTPKGRRRLLYRSPLERLNPQNARPLIHQACRPGHQPK